MPSTDNVDLYFISSFGAWEDHNCAQTAILGIPSEFRGWERGVFVFGKTLEWDGFVPSSWQQHFFVDERRAH